MSLETFFNDCMKQRNASYYSFIRNMVTLAVLILSITISFRQTPGGDIPCCRWLLPASWGFLALSVVCGLLAHYGEVILYNRAARAAREARNRPAGKTDRDFATDAGAMFLFAFWGLCLLFVLGLLSLTLYAVLNF